VLDGEYFWIDLLPCMPPIIEYLFSKYYFFSWRKYVIFIGLYAYIDRAKLESEGPKDQLACT